MNKKVHTQNTFFRTRTQCAKVPKYKTGETRWARNELNHWRQSTGGPEQICEYHKVISFSLEKKQQQQQQQHEKKRLVYIEFSLSSPVPVQNYICTSTHTHTRCVRMWSSEFFTLSENDQQVWNINFAFIANERTGTNNHKHLRRAVHRNRSRATNNTKATNSGKWALR